MFDDFRVHLTLDLLYYFLSSRYRHLRVFLLILLLHDFNILLRLPHLLLFSLFDLLHHHDLLFDYYLPYLFRLLISALLLTHLAVTLFHFRYLPIAPARFLSWDHVKCLLHHGHGVGVHKVALIAFLAASPTHHVHAQLLTLLMK